MRKDVKDIAVTRADTAVVGQERLGLSPFGMLSQLFNQQILQRTQLMAGAYPHMPLALLDEGEGEARPAADKGDELHLEVEVNVTVEAPERGERGSGGARTADPVQERLLERVRLLQRELEKSRESVHRVLIQVGGSWQERYRWSDGQGGLAAGAARTAAQAAPALAGSCLYHGANRLQAVGPSGVLRPMTRTKALSLISAATAALAQGGWTPRPQQLHPGYPMDEGKGQAAGSGAGSILLPDALRRRRREALDRQGQGIPLNGEGSPVLEWFASSEELDAPARLIRRVEDAVRRTLEENQARQARERERRVPDDQEAAALGSRDQVDLARAGGSAQSNHRAVPPDPMRQMTQEASAQPTSLGKGQGTVSQALGRPVGDRDEDGTEPLGRPEGKHETGRIQREPAGPHSRLGIEEREGEPEVPLAIPSPGSDQERKELSLAHRQALEDGDGEEYAWGDEGRPMGTPGERGARPRSGTKAPAAAPDGGVEGAERALDGPVQPGGRYREEESGTVTAVPSGGSTWPRGEETLVYRPLERAGEGPSVHAPPESHGAARQASQEDLEQRRSRQGPLGQPGMAPASASVRARARAESEQGLTAQKLREGGPTLPVEAGARRSDGRPAGEGSWQQEPSGEAALPGPDALGEQAGWRPLPLEFAQQDGEPGPPTADRQGGATTQPLKDIRVSARLGRGSHGLDGGAPPTPAAPKTRGTELIRQAAAGSRGGQAWGGLPELTFATPPWERQEERQAQVELPKGEHWKNLPQWARELLEKPGAPVGGAGPAAWQAAKGGVPGQPPGLLPGTAPPVGGAAGGMIQWMAPGARLPGGEGTAQPAAIQHRERAEGERQYPRRAPGLSEAEMQRTADKVYRIIEERLRRELRRSGR